MVKKIVYGVVILSVCVVCLAGGYLWGMETGNYNGYITGYDKGKEYVIENISQYAVSPKSVSYSKVVDFLNVDQTDKTEYSDQFFDCVSYSKVVKENANKDGIKCGFVTLDLEKSGGHIGHTANAFETTDRGVVYFSSQNDSDVGELKVGGTYQLDDVYNIYKIDIIW